MLLFRFDMGSLECQTIYYQQIGGGKGSRDTVPVRGERAKVKLTQFLIDDMQIACETLAMHALIRNQWRARTVPGLQNKYILAKPVPHLNTYATGYICYWRISLPAQSPPIYPCISLGSSRPVAPGALYNAALLFPVCHSS
jgi:hypothetical protein